MSLFAKCLSQTRCKQAFLSRRMSRFHSIQRYPTLVEAQGLVKSISFIPVLELPPLRIQEEEFVLETSRLPLNDCLRLKAIDMKSKEEILLQENNGRWYIVHSTMTLDKSKRFQELLWNLGQTRKEVNVVTPSLQHPADEDPI